MRLLANFLEGISNYEIIPINNFEKAAKIVEEIYGVDHTIGKKICVIENQRLPIWTVYS